MSAYRSSALILIACIAVQLQAGEAPVVISAEPLVDLTTSIGTISGGHYAADLVLDGVFAGKDAERHPLNLRLVSVNGAFQGGGAQAPRWNQGRHTLSRELAPTFDLQTLTGEVEFTLNADRWVPADGKSIVRRARLDGRIEAIEARQADGSRAQEGQWWNIKPEAQGAQYRVSGRWTMVDPVGEAEISGDLSGRISLPPAPGNWDMGSLVDGGVAFGFDMGNERQNWNHARLAQLPLLESPRDLSAADGLRLRVQVPRVRSDASLSVWLREADGSWYYVKDAIPLTAEEVEVTLLWEDFDEAEWVSPGNHMDEDYRLDTAALSHLAIGVVNSLGVGEVHARLLAVETVRCQTEPLTTAQVRVHGLLAVNGFNVVPAPLFGGYAPNLPAEYRPGCQRTLHFGLTGHPVIPRQLDARFGNNDLTELMALVTALKAAGSAEADSVGKRLWQGFEERFRQRNIEGWISKPQGDAREFERRTRELVGAINNQLGRADLLPSTALAGLTLPEAVKARVESLAAGTAFTSTELMELNRDLIHLAFPNHLSARPAQGRHEQYIIDCQGERLHPAPYLTRDDWKEYLHGLGVSYGRNARAAGHRAVMEFWNEPYLNWAERSRISFKVDFYRQDLAVEGGPVTVKRASGTDDVIPHFQWVKARDSRVSQTASGLMVVDTSAFSYWSGRGNGHIYDSMYHAMASGIKAEHPETLCLAGWGFRWNEDHWGAWEMLYKPTIDANIDLIDGIHEHHYQGDTTAMVGSYEMLAAYGMTKHQKWLRSYNTETNDLVDAPARGAVDVPENVAGDNNKNYRRAIYNLRDILYCIVEAPDKAAARTVIHHDHTPHGIAVAYGMMRDLRGRLMVGESSDDRVWVAASVDGSDPEAMPHEPGQRLVSMLFNDHRVPRRIAWELTPPPGTSFVTGQAVTVQWTVYEPRTGAVAIQTREVPVEAGRCMVEIELGGRAAAQVTLPLQGSIAPDAPATVQRLQRFAPDILKTVQPGEATATTVAIEAELLAQAKRAWLRVVVEAVAPDEAIVEVAGTRIVLPKAYTRDNGNRIFTLPIPVAGLRTDNVVSYSVAAGPHAGYRVPMTSIQLELTP